MDDVLIGPGLLQEAPLLPERDERRRVAVLTQPGAARLGRSAGRRLRAEGLESSVRVLPDGEAAKTLEVAATVYQWLVELGVNRQDTVLAVGGGALTDLAGFVAATYLRGVEVVYLPTTLVGAVDAAIGGKTGVNLGAKNLVGVFRQPARVVIDTALLEKLPVGLRREGLAEALKAGLVGDPALVELIESQGLQAPLEEVVARAVQVKVRIVREDFREQGSRAILNYGHTVGHALEAAGGLSHGEAVGLGMVAAGEVSARLLDFPEGERQRAALERLGLPIMVSGVARDAVWPFLTLDKKRDARGIRMVLLRAIGEPEVLTVDPATVGQALSAIGIE